MSRVTSQFGQRCVAGFAGLVLAGSISASACAVTIPLPTLVAKFGGSVVPMTLPKQERAPAGLKFWGKIHTTDNTHPSALRELVVRLDRDFAIDAKGLPVCHPFRTNVKRPAELKEKCRGSIVGGGGITFEVARSEEMPVRVRGDLLLSNGGIRKGVTVLYAVAFVHISVPEAIIIPIKIQETRTASHGSLAIAKVPAIAEGDGSMLNFHLKLKRLFSYMGKRKSYVMARCRGGEIKADINARFRNELRQPGVPSQTLIRGGLTQPCTPRD